VVTVWPWCVPSPLAAGGSPPALAPLWRTGPQCRRQVGTLALAALVSRGV